MEGKNAVSECQLVSRATTSLISYRLFIYNRALARCAMIQALKAAVAAMLARTSSSRGAVQHVLDLQYHDWSR
jgi:hypothetical protein